MVSVSMEHTALQLAEKGAGLVLKNSPALLGRPTNLVLMLNTMLWNWAYSLRMCLLELAM